MNRVLLLCCLLTCLMSSWAVPAGATSWVNVQQDCQGVVADGVHDDAPQINDCIKQHAGAGIFFPRTQPNPKPSYFLGLTLYPQGAGMILLGESAGFANDATQLGGTVLRFAPGVTGIWLDNAKCPNCAVEYLSLLGSEGHDFLSDASGLILPDGGNLGNSSREIYSIQRLKTTNPVLCGRPAPASCIYLTVTIFNGAYGGHGAWGSEGLIQHVGSTVLLSGISNDATMNGLCTITTTAAGRGPMERGRIP